MIKRYYDDGQLRMEYPELDMHRQHQGEGRYWNEEGKLTRIDNYLGGKRYGKWTYYYPDEPDRPAAYGYWLYDEQATEEEWRIYELTEQLAGIA